MCRRPRAGPRQGREVARPAFDRFVMESVMMSRLANQSSLGVSCTSPTQPSNRQVFCTADCKLDCQAGGLWWASVDTVARKLTILNTERTLTDSTNTRPAPLKTVIGASLSWVQIPAPPPLHQSAIAIQPGAGRIRRPDLTMACTVSAGIGQLNQPRMSDSGATTAARTAASKSAA